MNTTTSTNRLQSRIEKQNRIIAHLKFQLADRNRDLQTALAEIDCLRARNAMLTELAGDLRVADLTGVPTGVRRLEQHAVAAIQNRNKIIPLQIRGERVH